MNERIKQLRKSLGLSGEKFGEKIGVSKVAVSLIEKGKNNPSEQTLKSICREFNVNETWLRTGDGEMFNQLSQAELAARIVGEALSSDNEFIQNTFIALGKLTPAEWQLVEKFVSTIKDEAKKKKQDNPENQN